MAWQDLTNRFNAAKLGKRQLSALKDHIKEYFITSDKGVVDLKLDIRTDETLIAESDITDHYVESNEAYQDQISLKPKTYTVNGEVGELVWYQKDSASQVVGQVAQRLEGVLSFLPVRSKGFNQAKEKIMKAAQWVDTASNAVSKVSNLWNSALGSVNHQEQAYQELIRLRDNREPVSVESPWGILNNYVVQSVKLTQPKETKDKSVISIVFKQFRTTRITTVPFDSAKYQANALYERQPNVDNGKTAGENVNYGEQSDDGDSCQVVSEGRNYKVSWSEEDEMFNVVDVQANAVLDSDMIEYKDALGNAIEQCKNVQQRMRETYK